ncbi:MAG: hypothetical protein CVU91_00480 [Firmicutes bacterium HGW-Firmicutes-16]|nr:MAG: hypothetical protein CVU91_00480 [Firmicutes bacterium HGW-Firmicutes-16]
MDEKTKKTEQENPVDTGNDTSAEKMTEISAPEQPIAADVSTAYGEPEGEAPAKQSNKRLVNALIRAGAALIAAALLLAMTKLSVFTLVKGPMETATAHHEEMGSFVKQDIAMILGDLSDQGLPKNYMVAGIYDKLVLVHFTDRYLESAEAVEKDTLLIFEGQLTALDKYLTVEGTIETQSEDLSGKLYEWFDANKAWMQEKGVIYETNDAATYLSDAVLTVDTVNSMSETLVYVLTGLAALCLSYILVELVLMATGFYLLDPKKKKEALAEGGVEFNESKESEYDANVIAETSDNTEEKISEVSEECIKEEQKPEDNGSSEEPSEEKTETQEDK